MLRCLATYWVYLDIGNPQGPWFQVPSSRIQTILTWQRKYNIDNIDNTVFSHLQGKCPSTLLHHHWRNSAEQLTESIRKQGSFAASTSQTAWTRDGLLFAAVGSHRTDKLHPCSIPLIAEAGELMLFWKCPSKKPSFWCGFWPIAETTEWRHWPLGGSLTHGNGSKMSTEQIPHRSAQLQQIFHGSCSVSQLVFVGF